MANGRVLSPTNNAKRWACIRQVYQAGLTYRQLDERGTHYRIDGRFDFWPTTGRWRALVGSAKGAGAETLIEAAQKVRERAAGRPR